jgi:outer membrane protein assembly factor BamB
VAGVAPQVQRVNDDAWLAFGGDPQVTKNVVSAQIRAATTPSLAERWRVKLAGLVVASPLYAGGVLFVASEAGELVALDASTGGPVWRQRLPVTRTDCGNWGISSTPAIDLKRNRIYVVSGNGQLHAFDLASGAEAPGFPIAVTKNPRLEYVWGALRIFNDRVLVPIASYCDQPNSSGTYATGRLESIALDNPTDIQAFQTVATSGHLGGIWGFSGSSIEPDGSAIYTAVGNAAVINATCNCLREDTDFGDHIVKLSPTLAVIAANNPSIPTTGDNDFGAAPLLAQPLGCQPLAIAANKNGYVYAWNRKDLAAGPIARFGVGDGGSPLLDSPAWSPTQQTFYIAGARTPFDRSLPRSGEGIVAIHVGPRCSFKVAWTAQTGDAAQPPPIVVGDVVFASGGKKDIVALDAATGKELWRAATNGPTLSPPIEAAGTLYGPDGSSIVAWTPR